VVEHLRFILEREGLQAETDALALIARQGSGSMRDSISLLDQLTSYGQNIISLDLVRSVLGAANTTASQTLVDHLLRGEAGEGLKLLNEIIGNGVDPRQFTIEVVEYLRGLLLVKYGNGPQFLGLPAEAIKTMEQQAATVSAQKLLQLTERFNQAIREFRAGAGEISIPHLPLELAFVEMALAEEPVVRSEVPAPIQPVSSPPISTPAKAPPEPKLSPAERTAAPPAVVGKLTIEQLRDRWQELLEEVTRRKVPSNYLKRPMVADVALENHTVVIYFDKTYERAYERADKLKEAIIDAFQAVLGAAWVVDLRLSSAKGVPNHAPDVSSPDEASEPTAEKKTTVTSHTYESDPLVKSALDLGGKIKGTRSLPEATDS
jgi:DNA polymerase-3 subunit gamma/tau